MPDIGHNQPDELTARVQDLLETAQRWIDERPEIADEETAKKLQTFLMQINAAKTTLDDQRKAEKEPHSYAAKAVDERWAAPVESIVRMKTVLEPRLRAYMLANGLTSIKGDLSPRASGLRVTWRAECSDPALFSYAWQRHPEIVAAMQKIAEKIFRDTRATGQEIKDIQAQMPGVKFYEEHKVV